jgi:hypothetical protein
MDPLVRNSPVTQRHVRNLTNGRWVRARNPVPERSQNFPAAEASVCIDNYLFGLVSFTCEFMEREAAQVPWLRHSNCNMESVAI